MKLSGYREAYEWYSGKASDVARQLALAGIGVVWVFSLESGGTKSVPQTLRQPLFLFCIALLSDLIHYVVAAISWGSFHRRHEKTLVRIGADPDLEASRWMNYPGFVLFGLKIVSVIAGFVLLLGYLLPGIL